MIGGAPLHVSGSSRPQLREDLPLARQGLRHASLADGAARAPGRTRRQLRHSARAGAPPLRTRQLHAVPRCRCVEIGHKRRTRRRGLPTRQQPQSALKGLGWAYRAERPSEHAGAARSTLAVIVNCGVRPRQPTQRSWGHLGPGLRRHAGLPLDREEAFPSPAFSDTRARHQLTRRGR